MKKGQRIRLVSFNGTVNPDSNIDERENFWKLLNEIGTIIYLAHEKKFPNSNRVLIKFDSDLKSLGLECHNDEPNSLWILKSDLKEI
tara:strand:+ start:930 stop:1190 length:261 start_codon:yes stop_codon:yes gene_type:complete